MANTRAVGLVVSVSLIVVGFGLAGCHKPTATNAAATAAQSSPGCDADPGITLPPGFCATIFADNIGHARHMTVAPDGTVFVNTWNSAFFRNAPKAPEGAMIVALKDKDGDGHAETQERIGPAGADVVGGTGIALYNGYLYAQAGTDIVRYPLAAGAMKPSGPAETVVSGLVTEGHDMHPFVIDAKGTIWLNSGSATNSCQVVDRTAGSPGKSPCPELATRAGLWHYDANKTGQVFSAKERWATGIRNSGGVAFDGAGRAFAVQHGRDQLFQNYGKFYSAQQGAELPAEELLDVTEGGDFGWPYCYYDPNAKSLMLAPEYGGDGKTVGLCASKKPPVAAFPAHWAPNDVAIYRGRMFPAAWGGGAFIAFHGSWNRAPLPQGGYAIGFQPLKDGKAAGPLTIFADGFAGAAKEPGKAAHRPAGLAVGPDGALYVSDDNAGRIWRITYKGPADAKVAAAAAPSAGATPSPAPAAPLPVPPGSTAAEVALGEKVFRGEVGGAGCTGCHGSDGHGSTVGPDLTGAKGIWIDGSRASIEKVIREGVVKPKQFQGAMPAMGGGQLTPEQVKAAAAYVAALKLAASGG